MCATFVPRAEGGFYPNPGIYIGSTTKKRMESGKVKGTILRARRVGVRCGDTGFRLHRPMQLSVSALSNRMVIGANTSVDKAEFVQSPATGNSEALESTTGLIPPVFRTCN